MQVRDIMTPHAEAVDPQTSLREAAEKMKDLDVGSLPVCDNDRLTGMLTDRDIVLRAVAEGHDPEGTPVSKAMTPEVVYCFDDQDVNEAAELMKEKQIRRLMVLNRDKRLVGMLSIGDLAGEARTEPLVGSTLEAVTEPALIES